MEEFEIKFLEVDVPKLEKKLLEIGAVKVGEYNYSRMLLDYPDFRLNKNSSWVRLRTDGNETTLAYKERIKDPDDKDGIKDFGMKEIEVVVDEYNKTYEFLKSIGFIINREEKNKRVRYQKGKAIFDIDFWPGIPPYLEVEADSLKEAQKAADQLGFDGKSGLICPGGGGIYKHYGYNTRDYSSITFEGFVKK